MFSRLKGQPISELFPSSEHEYFQRVLDARFEFVPGAAPGMTALILRENGMDRPAKKAADGQSRALVEEAISVGRRVREQRPHPESEKAVRQLLSGLSQGTPDYTAMTPQFAELTRNTLEQMRNYVKALGPLRTVNFRNVNPAGMDQFDLQFAGGRADAGVSLEPDGRIGAAWIERR
jgi:hypothetical protein